MIMKLLSQYWDFINKKQRISIVEFNHSACVILLHSMANQEGTVFNALEQVNAKGPLPAQRMTLNLVIMVEFIASFTRKTCLSYYRIDPM